MCSGIATFSTTLMNASPSCCRWAIITSCHCCPRQGVCSVQVFGWNMQLATLWNTLLDTVGISEFVLFGVQNWHEGLWSEMEALMVTLASEKFTDYILGWRFCFRLWSGCINHWFPVLFIFQELRALLLINPKGDASTNTFMEIVYSTRVVRCWSESVTQPKYLLLFQTPSGSSGIYLAALLMAKLAQ